MITGDYYSFLLKYKANSEIRTLDSKHGTKRKANLEKLFDDRQR